MSATQSQPSGLPLVEPKAPAEILLTESMHVQQQAQPMDLANSSSSLTSTASHLQNNRGPSVVQFRPLRATFATQNSHNTATTNSISSISGKTPLSGNTILPTPSIISVNRNSNVTFLPTRGTGTSAGGMPTYQIARTSAIVGNIRAGQPGSITVTPMSSSNFSANIRLGTTVNNGSWIQANPQTGSFTPIRATTIISTVRQDGKMLQIPHQQGVQHLTQLQMVDNKGSIIRSPQITPLVNVRGLHPQSTNSSGALVPLPQFTIRAANINLPLQQRPQTTNSNTANLMQKVIHPGQGQPIQLLNTQKLPPGHTIQTITPISRLNTVCLTLTSNATLTPNSNPIVAMASTSRQGGSTPTTNTTTNNMQPITKVYPVRGDGSLEVGTIITHHSNPGQQSTLNNNIQTTSGTSQSITTTNTTNLNQQHHLVQVHGPLSGLPGGGNITSYYLDQKNNLQARPIGLDNKSKTTTMILATPVSQPNQSHGFTHPQQHAIPIHQQQHHLITTTSTGQQQLHAIPTQLITQSGVIGSGNKNSNNSNNTNTPTTGVNVPLSSQNVGTASTTTISNTSSTTTNISSSNTLTIPSSTTTTTTSSSSTPVQSPSQSKSTLSPRPSILRKREAASGSNASGEVLHQTATLRAQRNLALNFAMSGTSSVSSSLSASVAANLNNNSEKEKTASTPITPTSTLPLSLATSLSILKKEFQPPNEESCSSNSSSGSSTISTTSETAELQLQQQQFHQQQSLLASNSSIGLGMLHHASTTISAKDYINSQISSSSYSTNISSSQNGMPSGRSVPVLRRGQQGNKAFSKELDRVKGIKAKEESVSPRKKPRKQQLPSSDILDTPPEISFYQGKRLKRSDMMRSSLFEDFDEKSSIRSGHSIEEQHHPHVPPQPPEKKIVYYIKRPPQISLLNFNKNTWKSRLNHFERYAEVKSKDEKRPTVNDLANQKGVFQKINGWKVQHLSKQMDEIIDLESNVVANFNTFLSRLEEKHGPNSSDRDLNRIQELLKGNIQRCKVIRDQMTESRCQVSRILDHKPRLLEVINKYVSKRPIKKRERL